MSRCPDCGQNDCCGGSMSDEIAAARAEGRREGAIEAIEWAVEHPRFSGDCHLESDDSYRARGLTELGYGVES